MIPSDESNLIVAAQSHPGKKRENNEDRFLLAGFSTESSHIPVYLAIVADGIGGHQAGEVAAQITVDTIHTEMAKYTDGDPLPLMRNAVIEAGRAVLSESEGQPQYKGMGSTAVVAFTINTRLYTASVGDSRIYILQEGHIQQATVDHTWVQEAVDYGIISPDEAKNHPQSHVLRRHIGGRELPEPDFRLRLKDAETDQQSLSNQGTTLNPGDRILLCSDGLTDLVEDMEIFQILKGTHPDRSVSKLIDLALGRGGDDNITVAIVAVPNGEQTLEKKGGVPWLAMVIAASFGLVCLAAAAFLLMSWIGILGW